MKNKNFLFRSAFKGYVETVLIALVVALVLRFFVVAAYKIPTLSMMPNLAVGDFILVNQMSYGFKIPFVDKRLAESLPKRGDIVVFRCPQNPDSHCVKRVIGLPIRVSRKLSRNDPGEPEPRGFFVAFSKSTKYCISCSKEFCG
jgi:signal peptidase I